MGDTFGQLNQDQIATGDLAAVQGLYQRPGLAVAGTVFSHRTQRLVGIL